MKQIEDIFSEHIQTVSSLKLLSPSIEYIGNKMITCLKTGGKVIWMGNGGSAADSQHLAAELVGRYQQERRGLASIALTTDSSILTAISNDYGYEYVFARQIEALATNKDIIIGISTSGNSKNVIKGIEIAKEIGAYTIALVGATGGILQNKADISLIVPSENTARIQEAHILIGHILCEIIDEQYI